LISYWTAGPPGGERRERRLFGPVAHSRFAPPQPIVEARVGPRHIRLPRGYSHRRILMLTCNSKPVGHAVGVCGATP
jgi:hypothetical protein